MLIQEETSENRKSDQENGPNIWKKWKFYETIKIKIDEISEKEYECDAIFPGHENLLEFFSDKKHYLIL